MYSQNNEEQIILDYFKGFTGTLLDIGANDGKTLSNSLALIQKGWQGVLVEPDEDAFKKLTVLHQDSDNVLCYKYAIATDDGESNFYKSGTHLKNGDTGLLSTLCEADYNKWKGTTEFIPVAVKTVKFKTFQSICPIKKFDFITIDAEGMDYDILLQMDLKKLGCKLLCIEYNGINQHRFDSYVTSFGLKLIHSNQENLIYGK